MEIISASITKKAKQLVSRLPRGKFSQDLNQWILENYGDLKFLKDKENELQDQLLQIREKIEKTIQEAQAAVIEEEKKIEETKATMGPYEMTLLKESKRIIQERPFLLEGRTRLYNNETGQDLKPQEFKELIEKVLP